MTEKETPSNLQAASLSEPFAFRSRVHRLDTRLDFIPVLDLIVIAMLVSLLFTRFVSMPGVRVDLPVTEMSMQHSQKAVAVLTIGNKGMLFFNGAVFEAGTIGLGFKRYIEGADPDDRVLLIKADVSMGMQAFLRLCELAKEAGFVQVQLVGKHQDEVKDLLPAQLQGALQI